MLTTESCPMGSWKATVLFLSITAIMIDLNFYKNINITIHKIKKRWFIYKVSEKVITK